VADGFKNLYTQGSTDFFAMTNFGLLRLMLFY